VDRGGIRKVLRAIPPERVSIYTDCTLTGLKHIVANRKIQSLVAGTKLVRAEPELAIRGWPST
jgi:methionine synthase II (cobalamin-independent)